MPFDPITGEGIVDTTRHGDDATAATAASRARTSDGSSSGGASRPSSNIGLTNATRSASVANVIPSICGTAAAIDRYDRSKVTTPIRLRPRRDMVGGVREVRALKVDHPSVVAELPSQLSVTRVDRVHEAGAAGE